MEVRSVLVGGWVLALSESGLKADGGERWRGGGFGGECGGAIFNDKSGSMLRRRWRERYLSRSSIPSSSSSSSSSYSGRARRRAICVRVLVVLTPTPGSWSELTR